MFFTDIRKEKEIEIVTETEAIGIKEEIVVEVGHLPQRKNGAIQEVDQGHVHQV